MKRSVVIELELPITLGGAPFSEVTFSRPRASDLLKLSEAVGDEPNPEAITTALQTMVAGLCAIPVEALDEMDAGTCAMLIEETAKLCGVQQEHPEQPVMPAIDDVTFPAPGSPSPHVKVPTLFAGVVTIRQPRGRDVIASSKAPAGESVLPSLAERLVDRSSLTREEVLDLDVKDFLKLGAVLGKFMSRRKTKSISW